MHGLITDDITMIYGLKIFHLVNVNEGSLMFYKPSIIQV